MSAFPLNPLGAGEDDLLDSDGSASLSLEASDQFVQLLTREQLSLFRYITALIGDPDEGANILQETNLVLWRKASEFKPGTNFGAWARAIALWKVKTWFRDRGRDRHVFSLELVQQLSDRPAASMDIEPLRLALRRCVMSLRTDELEILRQRYAASLSIQQIADRVQKKPTAVKVALFRIRKSLRLCVERRLAEGV